MIIFFNRSWMIRTRNQEVYCTYLSTPFCHLTFFWLTDNGNINNKTLGEEDCGLREIDSVSALREQSISKVTVVVQEDGSDPTQAEATRPPDSELHDLTLYCEEDLLMRHEGEKWVHFINSMTQRASLFLVFFRLIWIMPSSCIPYSSGLYLLTNMCIQNINRNIIHRFKHVFVDLET